MLCPGRWVPSARCPRRSRSCPWGPCRSQGAGRRFASGRRPRRTSPSACSGMDHELAAAGEGVFAGEVDARPGDDYLYVLDGSDALPDPCSRSQPGGIRGPSRILDTTRLRDRGRAAPAARGARALRAARRDVHRGGNVRRRDPAPRRVCASLGVTAIELMPVATFPGERGWGYDGVYIDAPHPAYGGPAGLARLVDAAHRDGLGVILDVVYNHIGPGSEAIGRFGPYFTDAPPHLLGRGDRLFATRRARMGDRERAPLDARLPHRRPAARRRARRSTTTRPCTCCASCANASTALVIERDGSRRLAAARGVGARRDVARQPAPRAARPPHRRAATATTRLRLDGRARARARAPAAASGSSSAAQNHDQVGNRALGDRLPPGRAPRSLGRRALLALTRRSSSWARSTTSRRRSSSSPITSIRSIADATREGRKREFAAFDVVLRRGDPGPAGGRDVRALEAHPRGARPALPRAARACARELPRELELEVDGRGLTLRRGTATLSPTSTRAPWSSSA